jgi:light-regulated signal transduction histidine kinase (bacteriophytochrome)
MRVGELERFTHMASHDLKEPLRNIQVFSQLLKRQYEGKLDANSDLYLKYVTDNAKRMHALLNDLVEYARAEGQAIEYQMIDVDLAIQNVKADLKVAIEESRAEIMSGGLPNITADPRAFNQVLLNLVSNAIKFRDDSRPPKIEITAQDREDEWIFAVKDNGLGIPAAHLKNIFVMFKRLHSADKVPGTGMGLAIAQRNVQSMKGRIWVESVEGKGATFYFTIPKPSNLDLPARDSHVG